MHNVFGINHLAHAISRVMLTTGRKVVYMVCLDIKYIVGVGLNSVGPIVG